MTECLRNCGEMSNGRGNIVQTASVSPQVIRYSVLLYFPFTLSIRDVEKLLAERGVEVGRETIRCWTANLGPKMAANLKRRNAKAAIKPLRSLLKNTGVKPEKIAIDKVRSFPKAMREIDLWERDKPGGPHPNNADENSHPPIRRRDRRQQKFKSQGSAQRFLATHAAIYNCFNTGTHLVSRRTLIKLRAKAHHECAITTRAAYNKTECPGWARPKLSCQ